MLNLLNILKISYVWKLIVYLFLMILSACRRITASTFIQLLYSRKVLLNSNLWNKWDKVGQISRSIPVMWDIPACGNKSDKFVRLMWD